MASEKTAVHLTFKIFQIVVVVDYLPIALMNINLSALYLTIHDLRQRNNIAGTTPLNDNTFICPLCNVLTALSIVRSK